MRRWQIRHWCDVPLGGCVRWVDPRTGDTFTGSKLDRHIARLIFRGTELHHTFHALEPVEVEVEVEA